MVKHRLSLLHTWRSFCKCRNAQGKRASHLRLMYDKIHANVRGLEALGVKAEEYGSFLIPVIMAKLPSEVRLQIARVTTRDVWQVDELFQVIKCEVEARELSDSVRVSEGKSESQADIASSIEALLHHLL